MAFRLNWAVHIQRPAVKQDPAFISAINPACDFDQRRFSRTVFAYESVNVALTYVKDTSSSA